MFELESSVLDFCRRTEQKPKTIEFEVKVTGLKDLDYWDVLPEIVYSRHYKVTGLKKLREIMWNLHNEIYEFFKKQAVEEVGIVVTNPKTNLDAYFTKATGLVGNNGRLNFLDWGNHFERIEFELKRIEARKEMGEFEAADYDEEKLKVYDAWIENNRNILAVPKNLIQNFL